MSNMRKRSKMKMIWDQFRKSRTAILGLCILSIFLFFAIFAGVISDYDANAIATNQESRFLTPSLDGVFTGKAHIFGTDEYGRDVCYHWTEKVTTVTCHEFDPTSIPTSKTSFVGNAICDYRDMKRFSKAKGRSIAWKNCIVEMLDKNFVTREEAIALSIVGTSGTIAEIDMTGYDINIACKM